MQSNAPSPPKKPFWEKALYFIVLCIVLAITKHITSIIFANNFKQNINSDTTKLWSTVYTNSVYFTLFDSYDNTLADRESKNALANCVVDKLKIKFPKELNGVASDSIIRYTHLYGMECSKSLVLKFKPWNKTLDSSLKSNLLNSSLVGRMDSKYKEPFCDCYLSELKKEFPNGNVDTNNLAVRDSLIMVCVHQVKKRIL